jgi:hypothetical protein
MTAVRSVSLAPPCGLEFRRTDGDNGINGVLRVKAPALAVQVGAQFGVFEADLEIEELGGESICYKEDDVRARAAIAR